MIKLLNSYNNYCKPLSVCEMPHKLGEFGAIRRHDIHTGIDLYCNDNQEVYSITDGIVTDIQQFTGFDESPWWNDTYAIIINNGEIDILYGELNPVVKIGDSVKAGQLIGNIIKVLKKDKGLPMSMLHLECRTNFENHTLWLLDEPQPDNLLDPTLFIKSLYDDKYTYDLNTKININSTRYNYALNTEINFDTNMYLPKGFYNIENNKFNITAPITLHKIHKNVLSYQSDNVLLIAK